MNSTVRLLLDLIGYTCLVALLVLTFVDRDRLEKCETRVSAVEDTLDGYGDAINAVGQLAQGIGLRTGVLALEGAASPSPVDPAMEPPGDDDASE